MADTEEQGEENFADMNESNKEAKEKIIACGNVIQAGNISTTVIEAMEVDDIADTIQIKEEIQEFEDVMEDEVVNEIEAGIYLTVPDPNDTIANIQETKNSNNISSSEPEVITTNKPAEEEEVDRNFGFEQTIAPSDKQSLGVYIGATSSSSIKEECECMASIYAEGKIMNLNLNNSQFQEMNPPTVELINQKCHNLSISELRKKLAFCQVCKVQYSNHKLANMCLAKHGKRQCWLCLDILSSKKDDFYQHCTEHHSITRNGDIVGCPFCGKCFDFRQGLNQHIVKIHFAESISDLDAVASLSPTTLVDIFTGKPRTSTSSSEDIQSQHHQQRQNDYRNQLAITISGVQRDHFDPINIDNDFANVEASLSIPTISMLPFSENQSSQQQKEQARSSCARFTSFPGSFNKTTDILQSSSDIIANFSRPSVIALLGNSMQRMNVPPEQTLSSLVVEPRSIESSEIQQQSNAFEQIENNVEIVENTCLRLQKSMGTSLEGYNSYSKPARIPTMQMRVVSNPEKFDMLSYPQFFVDEDSRVSTTNASPNYEQMITRVSNVYQQQTNDQPLSTQTYTDIGNRSGGPTAPSSSNSHLHVNDCSDVTKGYYNSIGGMLKTVADMGFNDQSLVQNSMSLLSPPRTTLDNQIDPAASFQYSTNCQKTGKATYLNQEIGLNNCGVLKFPDNCGVKRRILMKAMWDEHQFKKPTHSHALVHDLNTAASLLTPPISQKQTESRVATFSRGYNDDLITTNGSRNHQNIQQIITTNRTEPKKDAGPFFEQYVREDRKRQGIPFKLLDLARAGQPQKNATTTTNTLNNVSSTTTSGGLVYNNSIGSTTNSCAHPGFQSTSWPFSTTSTFPRGQVPFHSNYIRGRRPSNPAFWDGLRARLMGSQSLRQATSEGNAARSMFHNPTSFFDCRFSGQQATENVILQNPFEEETSFQGSLNNKTFFGNNSDPKHKGNRSRNANENESAHKPDQNQTFFVNNIADGQTMISRSSVATTMRHHPYAKSTAAGSIYTTAQQSGNGCNSRMTGMTATFTPFGTMTNVSGKDETSNIACTPHHPPNLQQRYDEVSAQENFGQPPLIAPRYAEQHHHILNRLHNMDESKLCK